MRLVPSRALPIALIKHCAAAERIWFQRTRGGLRINEWDGHAVSGDDSFLVADQETFGGVIAEYRRAHARSNAIAADHELDDVVEHHRVGAVSLRFTYLLMIPELARHAGHADILAEQIRAGSAGRQRWLLFCDGVVGLRVSLRREAHSRQQAVDRGGHTPDIDERVQVVARQARNVPTPCGGLGPLPRLGMKV